MDKTIWVIDLGKYALKVFCCNCFAGGGNCLVLEKSYLFPRWGGDRANGSGAIGRFLETVKIEIADLVAVAIPSVCATVGGGDVLYRQLTEGSLDVRQGLLGAQIGVVAVENMALNPHLKIFKDQGLKVCLALPFCLALSNLISMGYTETIVSFSEQSNVIAVLSVGLASSELVIRSADTLLVRSIPMGGECFTKALAKGFSLPMAYAEQLKCRMDVQSQYAVMGVLTKPLNDFMIEVKKIIGIFQATHKTRVNKLFLVGGGAKTLGLRECLEKSFGLKGGVAFLDTLHNLTVLNKSPFCDDPGQFAICCGLALQATGMGNSRASFLLK